MPTEFNPYAEWLGTGRDDRSPNNYALLGLRLFESNASAIQAAADRQLHILASHASGPNSQLARRLRFEVESARDCLLNANLKTAYDASLASRQPERNRASKVPQSPQTAPLPTKVPTDIVPSRPLSAPVQHPNCPKTSRPTPALDLLGQLASGDSRAPDSFPHGIHLSRRRLKRKRSKRHALDITLALIPAFITLGWVYWQFGTGSGTSSVADREASSRPKEPPRAASIFDIAEPVKEQPPVRMPRPRPHRKPSADPVHIAVVDPIPQPAIIANSNDNTRNIEIPAARPNRQMFRPVQLPKQVDLPPLYFNAQSDFQPLFPLSLAATSNCKLTVLNPSREILGTNSVFEAEPAKPGENCRRWLVNLIAKAPTLVNRPAKASSIAEFALEQQGMQFRWMVQSETPVAQMLRNCILMLDIDGGNHAISMRQPQTIAAEPIRLEKQSTVILLPGEWLPDPSELEIEILSAQSICDQVRIPDKSVRGINRNLCVCFRQEVPQLEVRLCLDVVGKGPRIKTTPVIVDRDGELVSLTLERLDTMQRTLPATLRSAQQSLSKNLAKLNGLESNFRQVSSSSAAAMNGRKALMLSSLAKDIQKTRVAVGRAQKQIRQAVARGKILPELAGVARQIHGQAVLKYRIFFSVGNEKVEVLRVE